MNINILVLGFGVTGKSCVDFFNNQGITCKIFESKYSQDQSKIHVYNNNEFIIGEITKKNLHGIEQVIISPGFDSKHPVLKLIYELNIDVLTDIDLFKSQTKKTLISVTGTNGKTTVVEMLSEVLRYHGVKACSCGNNGTPPLDIINNNNEMIIFELSSYQLEYMQNFQSDISLILNISEDHLERHGNMENYLKIKKNILKDSTHKVSNIRLKDDLQNINCSYFGLDNKNNCIVNNSTLDILFSENQIKYNSIIIDYLGRHNLENILAVLTVTNILGLDLEKSLIALKHFNHLPHRMELIKNTNNVSWYNDSKATNCDATLNALKCFNRGIILIMGGYPKKQDYLKLASEIKKSVKTLILFGKNSNEIKNKLSLDIDTYLAKSLDETVLIAQKHSKDGDVIIFSPASPSFDYFRNFEHRGAVFKDTVLKIAN